MKLRYALIALLILSVTSSQAQVTFWTEDFGGGCSTGTSANNYLGMNGFWTVTNTGTNGDMANAWYISAEENGNDAGECGSGCGNDRSLHVGSTMLGDLGAAYYDSGLGSLCGLIGCGETDKRVQSPIVDCGGYSAITVEFVYIEGGNAADNASMWYFDGSVWSQLIDLPKTATNCAPQGTWTSYSIALPASANANSNVRIGFRWTNNEDGIATDPSFAIDDIAISGNFGDDITPPEIVCSNDTEEQILAEDFCTAFIADYMNDVFVLDDTDPFPVLSQIPEPGEVLTGPTMVTITATDISGNSSVCSFMVSPVDLEAPEIICPDDVYGEALPGIGSVQLNIVPPTVTDCSDYTLINDFNNTDDASDVYPIGITPVFYTVTDAFGNEASCSFNVIVEEIEVLNCCLGDFNCDGVVSVLDLTILIAQFGCTSGCTTDLNNDNVVGVADMQIFTGLYGTVCPQ